MKRSQFIVAGLLASSLVLSIAGLKFANSQEKTMPHAEQLVQAETTETMSRTELLTQAETVVKNYNAAVPGAKSVWPGYDPVAIPKIIVMRDHSGTARALIALDHPYPERLGEAIAIPSAYGTAHLILALQPDINVENFENFEFSRPVAGADTFLIASNCSDPDLFYLCSTDSDYSAFLIHEVFHRYQDDTFQNTNWIDQEVYDFRPEFVHATLIENHLFARLSDEQNLDMLRDLAREVVGVRAYRAELSNFVALDETQERIEGTAKFVETSTNQVANGFSASILAEPLQRGQIREELSFGRFYLTGEVAIKTAARLGVTDYASRITSGETPMEVLASAVDPMEPTEAFRAARRRVDPEQKLQDEAKRYADWVKDEPGLFEP